MKDGTKFEPDHPTLTGKYRTSLVVLAFVAVVGLIIYYSQFL